VFDLHSQTQLVHLSDPRNLSRNTGIVESSWSLATVIALPLCGLLLQNYGWHAPYILVLSMFVPATVLLIVNFPVGDGKDLHSLTASQRDLQLELDAALEGADDAARDPNTVAVECEVICTSPHHTSQSARTVATRTLKLRIVPRDSGGVNSLTRSTSEPSAMAPLALPEQSTLSAVMATPSADAQSSEHPVHDALMGTDLIDSADPAAGSAADNVESSAASNERSAGHVISSTVPGETDHSNGVAAIVADDDDSGGHARPDDPVGRSLMAEMRHTVHMWRQSLTYPAVYWGFCFFTLNCLSNILIEALYGNWLSDV